MTARIELRGVTKRFALRGRRPLRTRDARGRGPRPDHTVTALDTVDLTVADGEFLVVVGPSGCGKSTLLDLVGGLTTPTEGEILLNGAPVTGPGTDRGIVFQQYALLPWRTALGNIEFGLETTGLPRRERAARARDHLDLVGLTGFGDRHPHELSGGMKQRVAIARSLAAGPDVLLMDEPFAALDAQTREGLQEELLRIHRRTGRTIVFITHGIDEAVLLGDRVVVLTHRPGRIKEIVPVELDREGTDAASLRSDPEFTRLTHRIRELLHDEVALARAREREELAA
ncbi:ATP-binding cassette domain-containing protein [Streptomyces alkaliphilus]|uniref:ATP-binding cassette domain-containing protein n=1 Tax=Streptomyces alkaliphilus TaxID=1472722 RepID=A0A7W3TBX5_9ACTN|nr:ABC transporter ATP-binding protein [Streptomyces alkaliphilus]MBB0243937.1 ATP-binding cassette domain-containing protein [Streptomyces alkaliphilus]